MRLFNLATLLTLSTLTDHAFASLGNRERAPRSCTTTIVYTTIVTSTSYGTTITRIRPARTTITENALITSCVPPDPVTILLTNPGTDCQISLPASSNEALPSSGASSSLAVQTTSVEEPAQTSSFSPASSGEPIVGSPSASQSTGESSGIPNFEATSTTAGASNTGSLPASSSAPETATESPNDSTAIQTSTVIDASSSEPIVASSSVPQTAAESSEFQTAPPTSFFTGASSSEAPASSSAAHSSAFPPAALSSDPPSVASSTQVSAETSAVPTAFASTQVGAETSALPTDIVASSSLPAAISSDIPAPTSTIPEAESTVAAASSTIASESVGAQTSTESDASSTNIESEIVPPATSSTGEAQISEHIPIASSTAAQTSEIVLPVASSTAAQTSEIIPPVASTTAAQSTEIPPPASSTLPPPASTTSNEPATTTSTCINLAILYRDYNLEGPSYEECGQFDTCTNLVGDEDNNISSMVFQAAKSCRFYADQDCSGSSILVTDANNDVGGSGSFSSFNDQASSYICFGLPSAVSSSLPVESSTLPEGTSSSVPQGPAASSSAEFSNAPPAATSGTSENPALSSSSVAAVTSSSEPSMMPPAPSSSIFVNPSTASPPTVSSAAVPSSSEVLPSTSADSSTSTSTSTSTSATCTPPNLLNGGFESGSTIAPWVEPVGTDQSIGNPAVVACLDSDGHCLKTQLYDGGIDAISQTVTVCPKTRYTAVAYGIVASKKESCFLQICQGGTARCGRLGSLKSQGYNSISYTFMTRKNQVSLDLQVYMVCHGEKPAHVNTVYLDKVSIHAS